METIAGTHATLWSFRHTFTLTCVRPLVIVGWNAIDVHLSRIGLPNCASSHRNRPIPACKLSYIVVFR